MPVRRRSAAVLAAALVLSSPCALVSQGTITTPKQEFGANFGDDYFLANYAQISGYWQKLARESNRIVAPGLFSIARRVCIAAPSDWSPRMSAGSRL